MDHRFILLLTATACIVLSGCVRRTLRITSDPSGALVLVNHREVGRTPLEVDFTYYGNYDVQLSLAGYEPMLSDADANPPAWDVIGLDFIFEVAPFQVQSVVDWHFNLEERDNDLSALIDRARDLRNRSDEGTEPEMAKVTVDEEGQPDPAP